MIPTELGTTWRRSWAEALTALDKKMDGTAPEKMKGMDGVSSELFEDLSDDQRDKINFVRINEIYYLLRHHTTVICPQQQGQCDQRFKNMEKKANRYFLFFAMVSGIIFLYLVDAGIMTLDIIMKLLGKTI
jgi:hypothetical protein